jgi:hypothetical protein
MTGSGDIQGTAGDQGESPGHTAAQSSVHYVIVVHGVGEQRQDETVQSAIQRFAEARSGTGLSVPPFTLGMLRAQSEWAGYIELDGIPQNDQKPARPFVGRPSLNPGENLRFVDLHWADLMQREYPSLGEPVGKWGNAIIKRLQATDVNGQRKSRWMQTVLWCALDNLRLLELLFRLRYPVAKTLIFDQFLGDVQLYGESPQLRGQAVARFHEVLGRLHESHFREFGAQCPPAYSIIAHSLGTMMSLEALLYAHGTDAPATRLPGYGQPPWAIPSVEWSPYVRSFVTLGSPIDKFLMMWWLNYDHWIHGERFVREGTPIRHFNYCDEQDPIGHRLDFLETVPAYQRVFEQVEDVVYYRYPWPGKAHVDYWTDGDLFRRILEQAIDGRDTKRSMRWFKWESYALNQVCCYFVPSLATWIATVAMACRLAGNAATGIPWMTWIMLFFVVLIGMGLSKFAVLWRQSLVGQRIPRPAHSTVKKCLDPLHASTLETREAGSLVSRILVTAIPASLVLCLLTLLLGGTPPWLKSLVPGPVKGSWIGDLFIPICVLMGALYTGWAAACFWYYRHFWHSTGLPADFLTYVKQDPSVQPELLKSSAMDPTALRSHKH